jgi:enamine deaminase RidA (YjgF/YER057c/UK114 family)
MNEGHFIPIPPQWDWERELPPAPGIRCGNFVFLSGQIALAPDGRLVGEGDIRAQAHQCFQNIDAILRRASGSISDVVKLVTYFACPLTDQVRQDYWAIRRHYFGDHSPASTGVQVAALIFPTVLLEIDAVALLRDPQS